MLGPGQFRLLRRVLRLRRREAIVVRATVAVLLLLCIIGVVGYVLSGMTPAWWPPTPGAAEAGRVATLLENGVVTELSRVRPAREGDGSRAGTSEAWAVRIKIDDMNAWLSSKLPRWVEGQSLGRGKTWPKMVHEVRVSLSGGTFMIGARVGESAGGRIAWVSCRPEVRGGELWLCAASAGIGSMPLPLTLLLPTKGGNALVDAGEGLRSGWAGFPESPTLRGALNGEAPAVRDPSIRLADGRHVRLLGLTLEADAIVLTCETGR